ncbi:MAG: helix-turn-helix transcriptional regulator [Provencibacterium sp.]|jgi:AraC-like DNA-binding protein|nr:helix-turn-helix transcriptional regulator [Provencibacterium sp.]
MRFSLQGLEGRLIGRRGVYRYILPHPLLRPFIAHYTLTVPGRSGMGPELTLFPDASGCLVFRLGEWETQAYYWGPTTRTAAVQNDLEEVFRFFVEFRPCGAFALTGLSQADLADCRYALDAVDSQAERQLAGILAGCGELRACTEAVDRFFLKRLEKGRLSGAQEQLCRLLGAQAGPRSAGELAGELGYSLRHAGRIALPVLGMGLKTYERLLRLNLAVSQLKTLDKTFAHLSQEAGYYDQPHFIHDFKRLTGKTPREYLQNLSGFYNEELKFPAILRDSSSVFMAEERKSGLENDGGRQRFERLYSL